MFANVNGMKIYYEATGSGTPVLLIMGFGMSCNAWEPQVRELEKHHRVLRLDNRGVARSGRVTTPYTLTDLARDAVGVLDVEGIETAHVVGVSMGGMVAQELALQFPARVRSLTLIATNPGGRGHRIPRAKALALFLRANTSTGTTRIKALARLLYPKKARAHFENHPEQMAITQELRDPIPRKTLVFQLAALVIHDTRRRLKQLEGVPTLIARPREDILVRPSGSDLLHQEIPDSRMISFAGAGHGLTEQCALELNSHLLAHFATADHAIALASDPSKVTELYPTEAA